VYLAEVQTGSGEQTRLTMRFEVVIQPETIMNRNQTDGLGKQIKGGIKEGAAKVTGNKAGELEGKVEKAAGKVQSEVGKQQEEHREDQERRRGH
jgi:uncharacterized protein YjbJ (UPF0337 family)